MTYQKIGVDIGHNVAYDHGATSLYGDEDYLTMQVGTRVMKLFEARGISVVNCLPAVATSLIMALSKRVIAANTNQVDFYVSIHFNSGGGEGTEVFAISEEGKAVAKRVCDNIVAAFGYRNRGVKDGSNLFVVKNTSAPAILVECCFVDSQSDMAKVDYDKFAEAIVKGILNEAYVPETRPPEVAPVEAPAPVETKKPTAEPKVMELQSGLNRLGIMDDGNSKLVIDGFYGQKTTQAVIKFQKRMQLFADGIAGQKTWEALNQILDKPLLKVGTSYAFAVKYVQYRLECTVDGLYGNLTKEAVGRYQTAHRLKPDGIVGTQTWKSLIG